MYQPAEGTGLTVSLPGETVRAVVARVVNRNTCFVELNAPLLNPARQHQYRAGDIVCVRRATGVLGEFWEAVDERQLAVPVAKPKPKRKTPLRKARTKKKRVH